MQCNTADDFRNSIIEGARRMASLKETIGEVSDTLNNVRETLKEAESLSRRFGRLRVGLVMKRRVNRKIHASNWFSNIKKSLILVKQMAFHRKRKSASYNARQRSQQMIGCGDLAWLTKYKDHQRTPMRLSRPQFRSAGS
jgi:hypothetical protein